MKSMSQEQMLNRTCLTASQQQDFDAMIQDPVMVLQIGEGNFLRGFFDWMIYEARRKGLFHGSIAVTQPRPTGKAKMDMLKRQDGLYTLVMRGLENGERVERKELISVFSKLLDPYAEWNEFLELADNRHLQFVVSNTTEAGLIYRPETLVEGKPVESFPGKLALLLYRRFLTFHGDPEKGLIFLPCELLERNGDELRSCVLRYCENWELPEEFIQWVTQHNRFLNSLVDRIVTGYPEIEAETWFAEWGYIDEALCTAEPYHFWAIEAESELEEKLPLKQAGLCVHWVEDLSAYRLRKVRMLNGAHTLMAPLALLHGLEHVREVIEHGELGAFVREVMEKEIIPSIPLPEQDLKEYAENVYERFLNPFIHHRLSDIAMNSISKFKVRLLPSLLYYADKGLPLPEGLTRALAGLLRYYKVRKTEKGYEGASFSSTVFTVKDEPRVLEAFHSLWMKGMSRNDMVKSLLSSSDIWGTDLSTIKGLTEAIANHWDEMEMKL